ncbi:MAG: hypothetical protein V4685_05320 [Bacteroidota bacterium]
MDTKIALSAKELELVCNADWILTKHALIQKVYGLFGEVLLVNENFLKADKDNLPAEVFINPPKISRGENYKLLPYVMLDYPRYFNKEDTIAIRTFFWWGNFFSVNLQLSGRFKTNAAERLHQNFEWLAQNGYYTCVNEEPWEHHFDENNFVPLNTIGKNDFWAMLQRKPFIKLSKKIPLQQWQDAPVFMVKTFEELAGLISNH